MAAKVLTIHMAYEGLEERIWRDVEVSSKMRLDQLGYVVLATFDTMAYHLFELEYRNKVYSIPDPDNLEEQLDLADYTLNDLGMEIGDTMNLYYDFGVGQCFLLTLTAVRDMKRGEGRHFPWVTAMDGRGIIDDMLASDLRELVRQIDRNGKTKEPIYYNRYGVDDPTFFAPWNINNYDLKIENSLLKGNTEEVEQGYTPFWEDKWLMENPIVISNGKVQKPQAEKKETALSDEELCRSFFEAVLRQRPKDLRKLFQKDAVIEWPCTNERFTLEEYILADCKYPGEWDGCIINVLPAGEQIVLITKVWLKDNSASFHCVSIIRRKKKKISSLTEYWSDDGPAPQWRRDLGIGNSIETENI